MIVIEVKKRMYLLKNDSSNNVPNFISSFLSYKTVYTMTSTVTNLGNTHCNWIIVTRTVIRTKSDVNIDSSYFARRLPGNDMRLLTALQPDAIRGKY